MNSRVTFVLMDGTDPSHWLFKELAKTHANISLTYDPSFWDWKGAAVYAFEKIECLGNDVYRIWVRDTEAEPPYKGCATIGEPYDVGPLDGAIIAIW